MDIEEDINIVKEFNEKNRFRDCGRINNAIDNLLAEREEDKKKIDKLEKENKEILNSKIGIDLSYEYYIPKQEVKDKIDKYIEQRLAELTETGSYILDEGTRKQERLNGMQKGANDIKKILLEDK